MTDRPLLMIPGPIEISDPVFAATCVRPGSHLAPPFKASFSRALGAMRSVWCADADHQPFVVAGSGTLAMESAVCNLVDPGDRVLVVNNGTFGDRMATMLSRRGATVFQVGAGFGEQPSLSTIETALSEHAPQVVFATHVDTSSAVRADVKAICEVATRHGALSVIDGVCATAAETTLQAEWGADVVLTASQKAIGLPPGLALWVVSAAALERRRGLSTPPPMTLDWLEWLGVMQAYESESNAYFGTPPTTLVPALDIALSELLHEGMPAVFARHQNVADRARRAWDAAGLRSVSSHPSNTLSALYWPDRADSTALAAIKARGAIVAGGLHHAHKTEYFRVGHMGAVTHDADAMHRAIAAVLEGLRDAGGRIDVSAGLEAYSDSAS